MSYAIQVGGKTIGPGSPVFIIAELGYNFNTLDEALQSVDAAAEAGVDAIKLQTFRADNLTTRDVSFPAEAGGVNQYDEFKRYEISEDVHRQIFARARQKGLVPFSSPSHWEDVELLERVGVDLHKIGSDDLTNIPFLRYVARKKKPVIFSSGMATLEEVNEAIQTFHKESNKQLVLLQCVSNYPIQDPSLLNMRVIESYQKQFSILVGFSDHTTSFTAAAMAVALGAVVLERHFVLDKKLPVPDGFFSADPAEMKTLVKIVREAEAMRGDGKKRPMGTEIQMRKDTRKSLVARRPIKAGQKISAEDLIVKRPSWGVAPREWDRIVGRSAKRDIAVDQPISEDAV